MSAERRRQHAWRPWVLALGLLAWCALAVATLIFARGSVEEDLAQRAQDMLEQTGESWASARFEGRDAILEGESLAERARQKVHSSLLNLFGVRVVEDATTLLPERRPFTFSAVKDGKIIALSGYVPSTATRQRILDTIKAEGFIVSGAENLVRARGAPPGDFAALVTFGLEQLGKLPAGRITLSDGALAIEGRAEDLATFDMLGSALRGPLPYGMSLARFAVRPPVASPFLWSASREGNILRLSGYVPSEDTRENVQMVIREVLPGLDVQDKTRLADGAPSTDLWLRAVRYAAGLLTISPQLQISLVDSAVTIEGQAQTFDAYGELAQARRKVPEGFQLKRFTVEPPRASPFTWQLERGNEGVRLSGYAPSEETHRLLNDAVRNAFPGAPVQDAIRLASGGPAPEAWAATSMFLVEQLSKLRAGQVSALEGEVVLKGEALDSAAFVQLERALDAPPSSLKVNSSVVPPHISPFVFAVRRDKDGITVSGFFPSTKVHELVLTTLSRDFLHEKVQDVSVIGAGAPEGFGAVVEEALTQLARLETGEFSLADTQLHLAGTALNATAVAEIEAEMKARIKPPYTLSLEIHAARPGEHAKDVECQALMTGLMERGTILFNSNSARILRSSRSILDRLAYVLERCPAAHVSVEGHSDALGDPASNQRLSLMRAQAVVKALEEIGVAKGRLSAVGYGDARPVSDNETEMGRARNRRIEFVVKEGAGQ